MVGEYINGSNISIHIIILRVTSVTPCFAGKHAHLQSLRRGKNAYLYYDAASYPSLYALSRLG